MGYLPEIYADYIGALIERPSIEGTIDKILLTEEQKSELKNSIAAATFVGNSLNIIKKILGDYTNERKVEQQDFNNLVTTIKFHGFLGEQSVRLNEIAMGFGESTPMGVQKMGKSIFTLSYLNSATNVEEKQTTLNQIKLSITGFGELQRISKILESEAKSGTLKREEIAQINIFIQPLLQVELLTDSQVHEITQTRIAIERHISQQRENKGMESLKVPPIEALYLLVSHGDYPSAIGKNGVSTLRSLGVTISDQQINNLDNSDSKKVNITLICKKLKTLNLSPNLFLQLFTETILYTSKSTLPFLKIVVDTGLVSSEDMYKFLWGKKGFQKPGINITDCIQNFGFPEKLIQAFGLLETRKMVSRRPLSYKKFTIADLTPEKIENLKLFLFMLYGIETSGGYNIPNSKGESSAVTTMQVLTGDGKYTVKKYVEIEEEIRLGSGEKKTVKRLTIEFTDELWDTTRDKKAEPTINERGQLVYKAGDTVPFRNTSSYETALKAVPIKIREMFPDIKKQYETMLQIHTLYPKTDPKLILDPEKLGPLEQMIINCVNLFSKNPDLFNKMLSGDHNAILCLYAYHHHTNMDKATMKTLAKMFETFYQKPVNISPVGYKGRLKTYRFDFDYKKTKKFERKGDIVTGIIEPGDSLGSMLVGVAKEFGIILAQKDLQKAANVIIRADKKMVGEKKGDQIIVTYNGQIIFSHKIASIKGKLQPSRVTPVERAVGTGEITYTGNPVIGRFVHGQIQKQFKVQLPMSKIWKHSKTLEEIKPGSKVKIVKEGDSFQIFRNGTHLITLS